MKLSELNPSDAFRIRRRMRAGFTLAEVLAALAFMAIVIPVAVEGVRIASLAGQVAERKATALRVAERVLNEIMVTDQLRSTSESGVLAEGLQQYRWSIRSTPWTEEAMTLVTVEVLYVVQGRDYDVQLSTLADATNF